MNYRNASDIFPDELLKEIQKYSSGELIYVPSPRNGQIGEPSPVPEPFTHNATVKSATNTCRRARPSASWLQNMDCQQTPYGEFCTNKMEPAISNASQHIDTAGSLDLYPEYIIFSRLPYFIPDILLILSISSKSACEIQIPSSGTECTTSPSPI